MDYKNIKRYLGNSKQLFRVDDYCLLGGHGSGMRMLQVHNGSGMEFVCSVDRCMDLHYLRCNGQNVGFLTNIGDVAPLAYDDRQFGWLKSFTAGFMTTCGLHTMGLPSEYLGRRRGLHGRVSNCPAEEAGVQIIENQDGIQAILRGVMRECYPMRENLTLTRTIRTALGDDMIHICDVVYNAGADKTLHMMLYHFNLGFPILTEDMELLIPTREAVPRDRASAAHPDAWRKVTPPVNGMPEMCYYHQLKADPAGKTFAAAFNPSSGIGVAIHFDRTVLDHFVQWRQLTSGYYAMGLEPCNATIDGAEDAVENGSAKWLEAGESTVYEIDIELIMNRARFDTLAAECDQYQ